MFLKLPVDNGETVLIALDKIIYIEKYKYNEKKTSVFLLEDNYLSVDVEYEALIKIIDQACGLLQEVDYD